MQQGPTQLPTLWRLSNLPSHLYLSRVCRGTPTSSKKTFFRTNSLRRVFFVPTLSQTVALFPSLDVAPRLKDPSLVLVIIEGQLLK